MGTTSIDKPVFYPNFIENYGKIKFAENDNFWVNDFYDSFVKYFYKE